MYFSDAKMAHVPSVDAPHDAGKWALSLPPRSCPRKPGAAATACRPDVEAISASPRQVGSVLLGSAAALLVRMERCTCCRAARDRHPLASDWVRALLEVDLTQTCRRWKEAHEPGHSRADLPHGCRESHLG